MSVDVFGHTLPFMPDNFLDESLVNFLFGKEGDAGVSCIMRAVSVIDGIEKVRRRAYKSDGHISGSSSIQRMVQSFQQWEPL